MINRNKINRDNFKYKTQMCRHFEKGKCQRGTKCNFAHGPYEKMDLQVFKSFNFFEETEKEQDENNMNTIKSSNTKTYLVDNFSENEKNNIFNNPTSSSQINNQFEYEKKLRKKEITFQNKININKNTNANVNTNTRTNLNALQNQPKVKNVENNIASKAPIRNHDFDKRLYSYPVTEETIKRLGNKFGEKFNIGNSDRIENIDTKIHFSDSDSEEESVIKQKFCEKFPYLNRAIYDSDQNNSDN